MVSSTIPVPVVGSRPLATSEPLGLTLSGQEFVVAL